ncbi:MAG: alkaline phosphatase family protein [Candidatus Eremiobacteraeota bacterium]|nr:alkaline phosphatase family protein [Candidatus Eremiobacteraeota bacterium]
MIFTGRDKGPRMIVGHVTENSVKIWGRGDADHPVMFVEARDSHGDLFEEKVLLSDENAHTGVAELQHLQADEDYQVEVSFGATAESKKEERVYRTGGQVETFPEPDSDEPFTVVVGSCNFHGFGPFRNNNRATRRRAEIARDADIVLHTGDQIYADKAPLSFTLGEFREAYLSGWEDPGTREVLKSQANYMIPSDHEIVNGFALDGKLTRFQRLLLWARGQSGGSEREQYQELTSNALKAYSEFQQSHSPKPHQTDGHYYTFSHGRHQFFCMDNLLQRHNENGVMISEQQRDALFGWLTEHRDQPKFVVTGSPFVTEMKETEEKWYSPEFSHQRDEIIDFLAREKLDNVMFLAGDVHASCHSQMNIKTPDGESLTIHELVASPVNGTIMRGREKFVGERRGVTPGGTEYQVNLDEKSFLGPGKLFKTTNSNVMKMSIEGDEIQYEFHRTRHSDDQPARSGSFRI